MRLILKIKTLFIGMLVASPAVAVWVMRDGKVPKQTGEMVRISCPIPSERTPVVKVPVEIVTPGSAPRWVYVDVGSSAVPEPGVISLVAFAGVVLAFRRKRD